MAGGEVCVPIVCVNAKVVRSAVRLSAVTSHVESLVDEGERHKGHVTKVDLPFRLILVSFFAS